MRDEWYNQWSRATPQHGRATETITEGETNGERTCTDREIPSPDCRAFAIIEIETEANMEKSLNIPIPSYTFSPFLGCAIPSPLKFAQFFCRKKSDFWANDTNSDILFMKFFKISLYSLSGVCWKIVISLLY